ncbi:MAG: 30S ribosomal protein S2, partial [Sedimentisphaerales bacterium]|nr:30S ribosomal protein S2 [Sedimentisphaerales bacterium]
SKIHIINVKETLKGLLIAKKLLTEVVSSGKDVVFVGTKRQAQEAVQKAARKCGMHFIAERWLGGMLTNFRTVRSRLARLEELEAMEADGSMEAESKKQASRLKREMRKICTNLDGVRKMNRLPGVMVVVDARKEYIALREARKLNIPTIAILDTDSDPDTVDVAIPANDDSLKAIEILLQELAESITIAKTMVRPATAGPGPLRGRSRRRALASATDEPRPATSEPVQPVPAESSAEIDTNESEPETETEAATAEISNTDSSQEAAAQ